MLNDPVNTIDPSGYLSLTEKLAANAVAGALFNTISYVVKQRLTQCLVDVTDAAKAFFEGALGGIVLPGVVKVSYLIFGGTGAYFSVGRVLGSLTGSAAGYIAGKIQGTTYNAIGANCKGENAPPYTL